MENKNSFSEVIWKIVEEMMKDYDQVHMVIEDLPASVDNIDVWDKMYDSFFSCWKEEIEKRLKDFLKGSDSDKIKLLVSKIKDDNIVDNFLNTPIGEIMWNLRKVGVDGTLDKLKEGNKNFSKYMGYKINKTEIHFSKVTDDDNEYYQMDFNDWINEKEKNKEIK